MSQSSWASYGMVELLCRMDDLKNWVWFNLVWDWRFVFVIQNFEGLQNVVVPVDATFPVTTPIGLKLTGAVILEVPATCITKDVSVRGKTNRDVMISDMLLTRSSMMCVKDMPTPCGFTNNVGNRVTFSIQNTPKKLRATRNLQDLTSNPGCWLLHWS